MAKFILQSVTFFLVVAIFFHLCFHHYKHKGETWNFKNSVLLLNIFSEVRLVHCAWQRSFKVITKL